MDKTLAYLNEPKSKKQSIEWKHTDSQVEKKFRAERSVKKARQSSGILISLERLQL